jgi:hypothetical protein
VAGLHQELRRPRAHVLELGGGDLQPVGAVTVGTLAVERDRLSGLRLPFGTFVDPVVRLAEQHLILCEPLLTRMHA